MNYRLMFGLLVAITAQPLCAQQEKPWSATAELGATMTTGNTQTATLQAKLDMTHTLLEWKNNYYMDMLYSKDRDIKTASRWKIGAKGAYILGEKSRIFTLAEYEQDDFSGYDSVSTLAVGYSRNLYSTDSVTFDVDFGPGIKLFEVVDQSLTQTGIVHMGLIYDKTLSDTAKFTQLLVTDMAFESKASTLSRSETAITLNVFSELAMKVSFIVRHDNYPDAATKSVDTETTLTVLYTF